MERYDNAEFDIPGERDPNPGKEIEDLTEDLSEEELKETKKLLEMEWNVSHRNIDS